MERPEPEPTVGVPIGHRLITVGHGTLAADELVDLLRGAAVTSLVDIRTAPGSRRVPHMRREELAEWLPASGMEYRWEPGLGGFRRPRPDSLNPGLRNDSFRGYADYMETAPFWAALDPVLSEAAAYPLAVMCSESVWWRCHRRLVADATLLARGVAVEHLMHDGRLVAHTPTVGVRLTSDRRLRYDDGAEPLFRSR